MMGIAFLYTGYKNEKKLGFFGGEIWWNNLRIIHGICYLLFTILYFKKVNKLYILLLIDLLIGLLSFIKQYVTN